MESSDVCDALDYATDVSYSHNNPLDAYWFMIVNNFPCRLV